MDKVAGGGPGVTRPCRAGATSTSKPSSSPSIRTQKPLLVIRKQLDTVVSPKSKLTKPVRKPKATWVEPKFYADVEYRDITSDGLLQASSFKGLSKDGK